MDLMRESLRDLVADCNDAHAGLLLQRGLTVWEDGEKSAKQQLLQKVAGVSPSDLYKMAFKRWVRVSADQTRFCHLCATLDSRLYIGLNSAGALETGISTQHSYGMPMLPGSSIKGAVRHYAEQIGLPDNIRHVLFGKEGKDGSDGKAGALVWHDGWFIPHSPLAKPFVLEVVTVHHQQYYSGNQSEADEMESPVPNQQIAAQGSFYFVVEASAGAQAWAEFAVNLLNDMLQQQGMGAKTASGYGYFADSEHGDETAQRYVRDILEEQVKAAEKARLSALPEHEQWIETWRGQIFGETKYGISNQEHSNLYHQFKAALDTAAEADWDTQAKKQIAETFSVRKLQTAQGNWINDKRKKELSPILAKLRGE